MTTSPQPCAPTSLAEMPACVEATVASYITSRMPSVAAISPVVKHAANVLRDFTLQGGKRVRPTFAYLGWMGCLGLDFEQAAEHPEVGAVVSSVSSLEFLQACALIHDDIIDSSDTRRGNPTVHKRFSLSHAARNWNGHGETYGRSIAILVGDLALSWADDMFAEAGLPAETLARAWRPWRDMRTEVVCGQILDIHAEAVGDSTLETAHRVNRYKTAAYTVERPLHIGATLAGADTATIQALRTFGEHIGVAFQLRDDQLGVFGDPSVTGKPSGDDLREGKRTALIAHAFEQATDSQRTEIDAALGSPLTEEDVERIRTTIHATGAPEVIETTITHLVAEAEQALAAATISPAAREALAHMARVATERIK